MKPISDFRILAIEPDPVRGENLRRLIQQRVDADVMVVTSSTCAIAALESQAPDLVLASALLPPGEEEQLMERLRRVGDARDLPILTVPPVIHDGPVKAMGSSFSFLRRRRPSPPTPYDPAVVSDRIADAVARARAKARARPAAPWELDVPIYTPPPAVTALVPFRGVTQAVPEADDAIMIARAARERRDRAARWRPADIPWLGSVQTPWGLKLHLLNISATGLLVESPSKFMPDSFTELHLVGSSKSLVVPARLVRSEVSAVNTLGVKYHTAAVFEQEIDLALRPTTRAQQATPQALAELLMRVTAEQNRSNRPRTLFEQGLRELVPARDIQIRPTPSGTHQTGEAVYFTVPTGTSSPPILQVTFEQDYQPAEEELHLLKAAASVAAVLLQYEGASQIAGNSW